MEILWRVVDRINPNSIELNNGLTKAGDAISIEPDGHSWSNREETNPEWRLTRDPNMTENEKRELLEPTLIIRRKRKIDIDNLSGPLDVYMLDVTRTLPLFVQTNISSVVVEKV